MAIIAALADWEMGDRSQLLIHENYPSVAKFIVPDGGVKVDSWLHKLTGRYDNPTPESTISPQSGTMNLATLNFRNIEQALPGVCELAGRPAHEHRLRLQGDQPALFRSAPKIIEDENRSGRFLLSILKGFWFLSTQKWTVCLLIKIAPLLKVAQ